MQCPECKRENRKADKFCRECGAKLPLICPNCGHELDPQDKFCAECGTKLGEAASTTSKATVPKLEDMHTQLQSLIPDELAQKYMSAEQQASGENRPITALFADISGFTPLSNTQSSETMFQLVQDCFRELVGIVARYEGSISGFRGDGLLALFGAPILHENDAERAILAALDMRNKIQEQDLQVSIGINTAMMTVGEVQTQLHSEYTAYGTDINLAKRLQEAAEAGQIIVGSGTHRLTRRMFDFDTINELSVKGFAQSVTAYAVQQVKEHPEKLRGIEGLRARMIGREHEFGDLKDATDSWLNGQGQIVSVIGEAGIGKSRLVQELREYLSQDKETWSFVLEGRCVSIGQPISYWPFLDILRTYFGLGEDDDEATRARKVTESINQLMPQSADETLPLLGNLLSIKFGNELDNRLKFAGPEQIRHQTLMRLRDIFDMLSRQGPLLLILEDLHWADDLSLDLISLLMDELARTPLMLLCVYRPEKEHRVWQLGDQARRKCLDRYTELTLHPLSSHQSRLLVESLLTIDNLPDSVKDTILTKSEGNPFFIEEVIRSLIEQDIVYRENDRWKARDEIANVSVPDTIQSVVLARVDRLQSEAKYVLQCASVIGRLFRYRLLRHISHQEHKLDSYLSDFESKELVHPERTVPELEYAFKHAFTQESTYEGILQQRKMEFHQQVAESIERLYQERLEEYYEELAHHYSRSGNSEKTINYLIKAGEKAKQNYMNDSAMSHFQEALKLIEQNGTDQKELKLDALKGSGDLYFKAGKISEAKTSYENAIILAKDINLSPRQMVQLYNRIGRALVQRHRYDEVIHYGEMGLNILGEDNECLEAALMYSLLAVGNTYKHYITTEEEYHIKRNKYLRSNMDLIRKLDYSEELGSSYLRTAWMILNEDRDMDTAMDWVKELEIRADQAHDLGALASAWQWIGDLMKWKGDFKNGLPMLKKALTLAERIGNVGTIFECHGYIGTILLSSGNLEESELHQRKALDLAKAIGRNWSIAWISYILGDNLMCQYRWDEAISFYREFIEEAKKSYSQSGVRAYHRLAKAYLKKGDIHSAIQIFEENAHRILGHIDFFTTFSDTLSLLEEAYILSGMPEKLPKFCQSLRDEHPDKTSKEQLIQWYLESSQPSEDFTYLNFSEDFSTEPINSSWKWIDEFSDCNYKIIDGNGLEMHAANGRDLAWINSGAPRLMKELSGDFAMQVCISVATDEKPQIGGLLVWQNRFNFLHLVRGVNGKNDIYLKGCIDRKGQQFGRGFLQTDKGESTYLRLERSGDEFSSYCSTDGENWFTCGKMTLPMDDPIQVGIHAIGMIDRTIYCGEYKEGTATLFRNFKIWTKEQSL